MEVVLKAEKIIAKFCFTYSLKKLRNTFALLTFRTEFGLYMHSLLLCMLYLLGGSVHHGNIDLFSSGTTKQCHLGQLKNNLEELLLWLSHYIVNS